MKENLFFFVLNNKIIVSLLGLESAENARALTTHNQFDGSQIDAMRPFFGVLTSSTQPEASLADSQFSQLYDSADSPHGMLGHR